jgi:hypothetical protein
MAANLRLKCYMTVNLRVVCSDNVGSGPVNY